MGQGGNAPAESALSRVVDQLREAVVELETWRQNARSPEERMALHRVTALLNQAAAELRLNGEASDPTQQSLALPSKDQQQVPPT